MTSADLPTWQVRGERTIYDNRWVRLGLVDVEPPGTERFEHHVVHLSRASIALVLDDQDRVLMLWRYRFVVDRWGWELPGGIVEAGEDPALTAAREVEEETGWRPHGLQHLTTFQPIVGMVDSPYDIYVGRGADFTGEPAVGEESGKVEWLPLASMPSLIADDEILGSGSLVGILRVLALGADGLIRPTGGAA